MSIELVLEMVLAILLFTACIFAARLASRLKKIRQGQEELAAMIEKFDTASATAKESVDKLKTTQSSTERNLQQLVHRATGLVNELSVMVSAGDNIAGRLEGAVDEVKVIGTRNIRTSKDDARGTRQ